VDSQRHYVFRLSVCLSVRVCVPGVGVLLLLAVDILFLILPDFVVNSLFNIDPFSSFSVLVVQASPANYCGLYMYHYTCNDTRSTVTH